MPNDQTEHLAQVFRRLGADDPEAWARSEMEQGIPQLHRFLFVRKAWRRVVDEDSEAWIDNVVARYRIHPDEPYAGAGRAMRRMLEKGVARSDIVDLVRAMQAELLFSFCYLLDDAALHDEEDDRVRSTGWALVTTDADGKPTFEIIGGLHESVLEMDPAGREVRPRPEP